MKKTTSAKLRIAELRVKDHMTQSELAKQADLSKTTVSNLESGRLKRIELATIAKLCKALQCTPNDILVLPRATESDIVKRQRNALKKLLGSMTFDKPVDPDTLDYDLVKITDRRLKRAGFNSATQRRK